MSLMKSKLGRQAFFSRFPEIMTLTSKMVEKCFGCHFVIQSTSDTMGTRCSLDAAESWECKCYGVELSWESIAHNYDRETSVIIHSSTVFQSDVSTNATSTFLKLDLH